MSEAVLWKNLINRAFVESLEGERIEQEHAVCSDEHYERMKKIIGVYAKPRRQCRYQYKRFFLIALIAVLVFLSGCAVVVYAEDIGQLLFKKIDDGFEMSYAPTTYDTTEHVQYLPGVLPDGYTRTDAQELAGYAEYHMPDGEWFRFEQDHKNNVIYTADTDMKVQGKIKVAKTVVQYIAVDDLHMYFWENKADAFRIVSTTAWGERELALVIGNLILDDAHTGS